MSVICLLSDAILNELRSKNLGQEFTVSRSYRPQYELKDIEDIVVTMIPKDTTINAASRGTMFQDVSIDIAVQQKVNPDTNDQLDSLMDFTDAIMAWLAFKPAPGYPSASFVSIANDPIFDPSHVEENRQFTSLLTVTYRVSREIVSG